MFCPSCQPLRQAIDGVDHPKTSCRPCHPPPSKDHHHHRTELLCLSPLSAATFIYARAAPVSCIFLPLLLCLCHRRIPPPLWQLHRSLLPCKIVRFVFIRSDPRVSFSNILNFMEMMERYNFWSWRSSACEDGQVRRDSTARARANLPS